MGSDEYKITINDLRTLCNLKTPFYITVCVKQHAVMEVMYIMIYAVFKQFIETSYI